MVVDVPATIPDSGTLAPRDIARKFQSTSLAGLGDFCDENPEECGMAPVPASGSGSSSMDLCSVYPTPGCPGYVASTWDTGSGVGVGTGVVHTNSTDYNALLQSLIKAGVDVSKLTLVQPGTTLLNNGTVSRQNPGYAIPGTNSAITSGGSSTMLLAMLGIGAFLLYNMSKGNRG